MILVEYKHLDDFIQDFLQFPVFYDADRKTLFNVFSGALLLYRIKDDEEERKAMERLKVRRAKLRPFISDEATVDAEKSIDELRKLLRLLIGKKVKDFKVGDDGIDIEFEDGTTLELYILGEWSWDIEKGNGG